MLTTALSPSKKIHLKGNVEQHKALAKAFERGAGHGLLFLDVASDTVTEQDVFIYWKEFARLYLSSVAAIPDLEKLDFVKTRLNTVIPDADRERFLLTAPPMPGGEYLDAECLMSLWNEMEQALRVEVGEFGKGIADFFAQRHSGMNLLGRVCFNLAENKNSENKPFAFLATYVHEVSQDGRKRHLPLSRALEEYAGTKQRNMLLRLLNPIHRASTDSAFIRQYVDSGSIYHPIAWSPAEAHGFLKDISIFEKAGIAVRVPNWWKPKQPVRAQVAVRLGEEKTGGMGIESLLSFSVSMMLGEDELNEKEIRDLLSRSDNLVFFKNQWIELDKEKLSDLLSKWESAAESASDGVTFGEAMRLMAGIGKDLADTGTGADSALTRVVSGKWLANALGQIRNPEADSKAERILAANLKADLRAYQRQGILWLNQLNRMNLGAILADDMGLGKTIQVISLLLLMRQSAEEKNRSLLVVPASLIGNWKNEIERFAPTLRYHIAHPAGDGYENPGGIDAEIFITTYGTLGRVPWLSEEKWNLVVADEAQAIKNPQAKQTKAIKALQSGHRIALTGTPVENRLSDLWSLFDFVSPGLLGTTREFESFLKSKKKANENPYAAIRQLVQPYILRRLKTDKKVIADLPDKTELKSFCQLSKAQAALYQKSVASLAHEIQDADGMKRRGLIFSYLMRFKQICNHPAQAVKDTNFAEAESGKFLRLKEICAVIAEKQEKVLVFTQFKEMTSPLHDFLRTIFNEDGLVLHGETPVKKRSEMVKAFQADTGPAFFILSLKAGGTGLNLTAASHVIHFDRWWNPAVENQATDRAFRIGQKRNVLVHKFVCKGTLEEKIDALIESKKSLSDELLADNGGILLTEMNDAELLRTVALDLQSAIAE